MKKIICFGGGNVVPKLIMEPLKNQPVKITGITSMVDNGGSTGQLREDFDVLPPGDIRRHLLALSDAPEWKKELWAFRFGHEVFDGGHKGHNFANVFIGGLEHKTKDYEKVLEIIHEFMELKEHQALPATTDKTQIMAVLENEEIICGEDEIDVPKKHNANLKIKEVYLDPKAKAYPKALEAIEEADLIVIGPGDLYSSIISCFLSEGIKETMQKTKARKILICPAMTKKGETHNFSVNDFCSEVEKYIGCELDCVLFNNYRPGKERIEAFQKENPELKEIMPFEDAPKIDKYKGKNLLLEEGPVKYDSKKVIEVIKEFYDE